MNAKNLSQGDIVKNLSFIFTDDWKSAPKVVWETLSWKIEGKTSKDPQGSGWRFRINIMWRPSRPQEREHRKIKNWELEMRINQKCTQKSVLREEYDI